MSLHYDADIITITQKKVQQANRLYFVSALGYRSLTLPKAIQAKITHSQVTLVTLYKNKRLIAL